MKAEGVIDLPSPYSVAETADKLQTFLLGKGMKIFARIDQAAEAVSVGLTLRPTVLLLFGNPKAGTPLMGQFPSLAIDLPLKVLIWESSGKTCVSLPSPPISERPSSFTRDPVCAHPRPFGRRAEIKGPAGKFISRKRTQRSQRY